MASLAFSLAAPSASTSSCREIFSAVPPLAAPICRQVLQRGNAHVQFGKPPFKLRAGFDGRFGCFDHCRHRSFESGKCP